MAILNGSAVYSFLLVAIEVEPKDMSMTMMVGGVEVVDGVTRGEKHIWCL